MVAPREVWLLSTGCLCVCVRVCLSAHLAVATIYCGLDKEEAGCSMRGAYPPTSHATTMDLGGLFGEEEDEG